MAKQKMTESELLALTSMEMQRSIGHYGGRLAENRRKALQYYMCEATGDLAPPEIEGRSSVVSSDVADTINWMLPNLIKTFTSGDSAVEFVPRNPGYDQLGKQVTEYINHVFYQQNNGFQILHHWFLDALLSKNGFVKIWWDEHEVEAKEDYEGLSEIEVTQLLQDKEVEAIESRAYPDESMLQQWQQAAMQAQAAGQPIPPQPMMYDITVKRTTQRGQVKIDPVPPEQFFVSRETIRLEDARFVGHQFQRSRSALKAAGYQDVDKLTSDENVVAYSPERMQRLKDVNGWGIDSNQGNGDSSQDLLWVSELYIQCDYDGDGISEWRKVVRAGNTILENEECDGHPFVTICPNPLPHQLFGQSIADMTMEAQRIKTSVIRSLLDNLYLQVNGRYFAVEGQVSLDDLMTSRPGGIVRCKQPGMVGRLDQSMADFGDAYQLLEVIETAKENRSGFTRYSQGTNADALNQTATGMNIITNRSDLRLELIARNFAETGVKPLFNQILKLVCKHQNDTTQIRIAGNWLTLSPREWRDKFELSINVGLGTGNKDQAVQHLQLLLQTQQQAAAYGLVQPQHAFNALSKLAENLGFKNPEQFFVDPTQTQIQPPPNPEIQIAQMATETEKQKAQAKMIAESEMKKAELELDKQKTQAKMMFESEQQRAQAAIDAAKLKAEIDASKEELAAKMELELRKAQIQAAAQIEIERIKAMQYECQDDANDVDPHTHAMLAMAQGLQQTIEALGRPKQVLRDENGRVIGVQ